MVVTIPLGLIFSAGSNNILDFMTGRSNDVANIFTSFHAYLSNYISETILTSAIFASLTPAFLTVFYYDLRTRKDGPLEYPEELPSI